MSLTKVTYSMISGTSLNVLDFGAIGNGTTDDTTAINAALSSAATNKKSVYFPDGTYLISNTLAVLQGVTAIYTDNATLKCATGSASNTGFVLDKTSNCTIDGFKFDYNNEVNGMFVFAYNCHDNRVSNNYLYNIPSTSRGIMFRAYNGEGYDVYNNIIENNILMGAFDNTRNGLGITLETYVSVAQYSPYVDWLSYWRGTGTSFALTDIARNNIVKNNRIYGFYYGIRIHGASENIVTGNIVENNTRNISIQEDSHLNVISDNLLLDSNSAAIHTAHGPYGNLIANNNIRNTVNNGGEAMLQAYVQSTNNTFIGNKVYATTGSSGPKFLIYCGVNASDNKFIDNTLVGRATHAFIGVESEWYSGTTNPASYAYGVSSTLNADAKDKTENVTISGNTLYPQNNVPGIFLSQITTYLDTAPTTPVVYNLENIQILNNTITTGGLTSQLEVYEVNSGSLNNVVIKGNNFYPTSTKANFSLSRGRAHFVAWGNNTVFDLDEVSITFDVNDTTPSVAVGTFFDTANTNPTSITYFDDGTDGQTISVRLDLNTTIVYDVNKIRTKGGVDIVGSTSGGANAIVTFRRMSNIWFEQSRNF